MHPALWCIAVGGGLLLLAAAMKLVPTRYKKLIGKLGAKRVAVLVAGDVGHSPRMANHALSLAHAGYYVDLIGFGGSQPHPDVLAETKIKIRIVASAPSFLNTGSKLLFPILAPVKVGIQIGSIFTMLCYVIDPPSHILVQNPPSLPTLLVARIACWLRGSRLVIDWHNFGYTILGLKLGKNHPLVRISEWYERFFGKLAHAHFTVTDAMAIFLKESWGIKGPMYPLHDRPAAHFQPLPSQSARHEFLSQNTKTKHYDFSDTRLLISSTSWTPDEDFSILLEALKRYDASPNPKLPQILAIITGKGPQKAMYEQKIMEMNLKYVKIQTVWLKAEDYPKLLAAADLGVCLHMSSSGLDLPMKVVDMFGCGVPVCAMDFKALPELVRDGQNGVVFKTSEELAGQLERLFGDETELARLRKGAEAEGKTRWEEEWNKNAAPVFLQH
ncbi:putative beta-1,4-mannosyltransferase [Saitoella complicata NRRL Y-17804]|uniref:Chitobiosyldiphosphodolichol beta-mannosyltransferase n=1 Tax=Saitoella complicata (strain BCRC 22490 / CBS 7301 / JCM 7358 / NBRC 10748 / NRRL Y-17804) TaxID=698492 RepID=A0A0E9NB93_SAICN|nr:putative beta-1,4-mannosyltransferase [Saitoella complicata NRRL Y-17804]ODQ55276.1 putative beta-1,4-mannosyltransferase [Saitoella complicata NRRL Y-17804]GAO47109.1 hypothetical protein G7K_1321-t1 [Saitoella complicata NRRL Y-17804]